MSCSAAQARPCSGMPGGRPQPGACEASYLSANADSRDGPSDIVMKQLGRIAVNSREEQHFGQLSR